MRHRIGDVTPVDAEHLVPSAAQEEAYAQAEENAYEAAERHYRRTGGDIADVREHPPGTWLVYCREGGMIISRHVAERVHQDG